MLRPLTLGSLIALALASAVSSVEVYAQSTGAAGPPREERRADAARAPQRGPRITADTGIAVRPPVTPRRAFLYSLAVPGAGQAALGRQFWGGAFFLTEGLSLALVYRAAENLRLARQFRADSVPLTYQVDAAGQPVLGGDGRPAVATWSVSRYSAARVRARRTHYEDWVAVLIFNHLIAGADAYVAAQLWDLPARVGVRAAPDGRPAVAASIAFR
ncbi:MAG: hypothetical protein C0497_13560 [Gemmatimonas sp.]|nr:hypothetical protein [Gemmatimonas sp.]